MRPFYLFVLALIAALPAAHAQTTPDDLVRAHRDRAPRFIANRGQWDSTARYLVRLRGLDAWVTDEGIVYVMESSRSVENSLERDRRSAVHSPQSLVRGPRSAVHRPQTTVVGGSGAWLSSTLADRGPGSSDQGPASADRGPGSADQGPGTVDQRPAARVCMRFAGSSGRAVASASNQAPFFHNYYIGSDRSRWATGVPLYEEVSIEHLYDGIDARVLVDVGGLRYDLHVSPGADPSQVAIEFDGADDVRVDANGDLVVATASGEIRQQGLRAFQTIDGVEHPVDCGFARHADGRVGFALGDYDRSHPLVIDPLVWGTYFGASNEEMGPALAVDSVGNVYFTGLTYSPTYQTRDQNFDVTFNGAPDVVVTRLNVGGFNVGFSTFLGGVGVEWSPRIAIDDAGQPYVACVTGSNDFPTTPGAFDESRNGNALDAAVVKLGRGALFLIYSTILGGAGQDDDVDIVVDRGGVAYVSGWTASTDFPTTPGAYSTTYAGGGSDAFLTAVAADGASLLFSTFLGGSAADVASSVAIDSVGALFVAGYTESTNFPTTQGAMQTTLRGAQDAFIARLNPSGTTLIYSTFFGGSAHEGVAYVEVDGIGDVYIAGLTGSTDFPVTTEAFQRTFGSQYVARINSLGTAVHYSTFLGGPTDRVNATALGRAGFFCLTGTTSSRTFPTTADAESRALGGATDAYVTVVRPSGSTLAYSTYFGGAQNEQGHGIGLDRKGDLYIGGMTSSPNLPGLRNRHSGLNDFYIGKIARCFTVVDAGADRAICFGDSVRIGTPAARGIPPYTYLWTSQGKIAHHDSAEIRVQPTETTVYILTALDAIGCDAVDTVIVTVNTPPVSLAGDDRAICAGDPPVRIGAPALGNAPPFTYAWSPATGLDLPAVATPNARPDSTTTYMLVVTDANGCRAYDTVVVAVDTPPVIEPPVDYETCAGESVAIGVTASGAGPFTYEWSPATGLSDPTAASPDANPSATTQYRVTVTDTNGCASTSPPMTVTVGASLRTRIAVDGSLRLCPGASVTLDAGAYERFTWSNGMTTRTITVSDTGTYSVAIVSATGCSGISDTVRVVPALRADTTLAGPLTACVGTAPEYTGSRASGSSNAWRIAGTAGRIEVGQASATVRVRWDRPGVDTLFATITSADGCRDSAVLVVTIVDAIRPAINPGPTHELCAGETVTLDAGGPFGSYRWSTGETTRSIVVREAGEYWVDAGEGDCVGRSDTVVVSVRSIAAPEITALGTAICRGDTATLVASDGYAGYRWSSGATGQRVAITEAGRYRVTAIDADGCEGVSEEVEVIVHPDPAAPTITVHGDTLEASPAASYRWLRDGEEIAGAVEQRLTGVTAGRYGVEVTDANGCRSGAAIVVAMPERRFVRMDTASATVGVRFRLGFVATPRIGAAEGVDRYDVRLRIEPRDLFAHAVHAPSSSAGAIAPQLVARPDGSIDVTYAAAQAVAGDTLFTLELQGLSTAKPVTVVRIDSAAFGDGSDVAIAGHGLVLLDGCDVGQFAIGKRVRISDARVEGNSIVVTYRAPAGAHVVLALYDASGNVVATATGDGGEQRVVLPTSGAGVHVVEVRDREERVAVVVAR